MKAITHKGEIGLVLSPKEASILWGMFYFKLEAKAAWTKGAKENPAFCPESDNDEFSKFTDDIWGSLSSLLHYIHEKEAMK